MSSSWLIYSLAIMVIYKIFQPHIHALIATTTTTSSAYSLGMKIPNLGDEYIISPEIQSTIHIDYIIRQLNPKSWISLLTDQEAASYQYAYIENYIKSTGHGNGQDGNIQYHRIGMDTSQLGTNATIDLELAKKIIQVLEDTPTPVVIQSGSGHRASAVYAVMHGRNAIHPKGNRYDDMATLSKKHQLPWAESEMHRRFVKTYLNFVDSVCLDNHGHGTNPL